MTNDEEPPAEGGLRTRKKRWRRERIVEAAFELFAEHGYEETTIEMIAEAAMVSPRTVFRYFDRKSAIAFADSSQAIVRLVERVRPRYAEEPTISVLIDAFAEHVSTVENDARFVLRERLVRENKELAERALTWRQDACDELAGALAEHDGQPVPTLQHRALVQAVFAAWTAAVAHRAQGGEGSLSTLIRGAAQSMRDNWTEPTDA